MTTPLRCRVFLFVSIFLSPVFFMIPKPLPGVTTVGGIAGYVHHQTQTGAQDIH
jgi:hypothetical protein